MRPISLNGVGSVFAITRAMKRWTAPQGSYAATVEDAATCSFYELISATTPTISSCTVKAKRQATPSFTEMERVEVKLTSILRGG